MAISIRKKCFHQRCVMCVAFLLAMVVVNFKISFNKYKKDYQIRSWESIPFILVMCKGTSQSITSHQLRQTKMLLKSAAVLTNVNLRFIIFSDSRALYEEVVSPMNLWDVEHKKRINVTFSDIRYPEGSAGFRALFKPCASFRLLVPDLLPHIDAAVYTDTDMIWTVPPEEILKEFSKFKDTQLIGSAQAAPIGIRDFQKRFNLPGTKYINSGALLMNFTRMRLLPGGGFSNIIMNIYEEYKGTSHLFVQEIMSIHFAEHPDHLYELGCEWNYHHAWCMPGRNCLEAETNGTALVHGGSSAFFMNHSFRFFFDAWDQYELGTPLRTLARKIVENEIEFKLKSKPFMCSKTNISHTFTNKMLMKYT